MMPDMTWKALACEKSDQSIIFDADLCCNDKGHKMSWHCRERRSYHGFGSHKYSINASGNYSVYMFVSVKKIRECGRMYH